MKRYELIREVFNSCDNSKMRDVDIKEIETDDLEEVVSEYTRGRDVRCEKLASDNGVAVYDIDADGLTQRLIFTEIL